jgi:hypothetical protein
MSRSCSSPLSSVSLRIFGQRSSAVRRQNISRAEPWVWRPTPEATAAPQPLPPHAPQNVASYVRRILAHDESGSAFRTRARSVEGCTRIIVGRRRSWLLNPPATSNFSFQSILFSFLSVERQPSRPSQRTQQRTVTEPSPAGRQPNSQPSCRTFHARILARVPAQRLSTSLGCIDFH